MLTLMEKNPTDTQASFVDLHTRLKRLPPERVGLFYTRALWLLLPACKDFGAENNWPRAHALQRGYANLLKTLKGSPPPLDAQVKLIADLNETIMLALRETQQQRLPDDPGLPHPDRGQLFRYRENARASHSNA